MNPSADRTVWIRDQITDEVANTAIAQLLFHQMQDRKAPVRLMIDSHGGSVTASLAIVDTIKFLTNPVHTVCRGQAAGMALFILGSGTKGFRSAGSDAHFQFTRIVFREITAETVHFVEKLRRRLVDSLAAESGQAAPTVARYMEDETVFSAAGLLAFGLIDRIDT